MGAGSAWLHVLVIVLLSVLNQTVHACMPLWLTVWPSLARHAAYAVARLPLAWQAELSEAVPAGQVLIS